MQNFTILGQRSLHKHLNKNKNQKFMKYTTLGLTGIKVSKICFGTMSFGNTRAWNIEIDQAKPIVKKALDLGINFFDTANVYANGRSEEIIGELLKEVRDEIIIATKVRFSTGDKPNDEGLNRNHIRREVKKSLHRLQTDNIDLYQIHRLDYTVSMDQLMRSLNHLIDEGLVNHIGASSMYTWELAKANYLAEKLSLEKFTSMQNHYNAIYREEEREMIPYCIDEGMAVIPWSPLARGFLSGAIKQKEKTIRNETDAFLSWYDNPNNYEVLDVIENCATENDLSVSQMALAWVLHQKGITSPILGVTKLSHLEEAVTVVDATIDQDYFKRISEAYTVRPILGHSYNNPLGR